MNSSFTPDNKSEPVYGELRLKNGDKAAAFSGSFKDSDLNLDLRLYPHFAFYFVPGVMDSGKTGKNDRRKIHINIQDFIKR